MVFSGIIWNMGYYILVGVSEELFFVDILEQELIRKICGYGDGYLQLRLLHCI